MFFNHVLAGFLAGFLFLVNFAEARQCDADAFSKLICVSSDKQELNGEEMQKMACEPLQDHPVIANEVRTAFELAPQVIQERLCELHKIGIYDPPSATTLSWSYATGNGQIGLSKKRVEGKYRLADHGTAMMTQAKRFRTWETSASSSGFGYHAGPDSMNNQSASGLLYLMLHELGHIIYNSSDLKIQRKYFSTCSAVMGYLFCGNFEPAQFGSIDWISGNGKLDSIFRGIPVSENKQLRDFISTDLKGVLRWSDADSFFRSLEESSFVSAFAIYSPEEDFCESFAQYHLAGVAAPFYFHHLDGSKIDVWQRVRSPMNEKLRQKMRFIKCVSDSECLKSPF